MQCSKRIVCLFLAAVTLLLAAVSCGEQTLSQVSVTDIQEDLSVGDSIQLQVVDQAQKAVDADRLLWSSGNRQVAKVSPTGEVTICGAGFCEITVMDKNNLSNQDKVGLFVPYETVPDVEYTKAPADPTLYSAGGAEVILDSLTDAGKVVVQTMTGKVSSLSIVGTVASFFAKDKYVITLAECGDTVKDGVIFTVCDWNDSNMYIPNAQDRITAEAIYQSMDYALNTEHHYGSTFDALAARVQAETVALWPENDNYRFDLMDDRYEYRVVVRADYTTFRTVDYYSNGVLTGLGYTIQDIWNWDLSDLNANYMYEVVTYDVVNVENVRLCIEYREKQ